MTIDDLRFFLTKKAVGQGDTSKGQYKIIKENFPLPLQQNSLKQFKPLKTCFNGSKISNFGNRKLEGLWMF